MKSQSSPKPNSEAHWLAKECQAFDHYLQSSGLPPILLMEQAAQSLTNFLVSAHKHGISSSILFLCGPGNNGADAIASARQLLSHPWLTPLIHLPGGQPASESLLKVQHEAFQYLGGVELGSLDSLSEKWFAPISWLVDGLFGVGIGRPIAGAYGQALQWVRDNKYPVLAVDCPSGLDCDRGEVLGDCLAAEATVSFIGRKAGFYINSGPSLCGRVQIAGIGVRSELAEDWLLRQRQAKAAL